MQRLLMILVLFAVANLSAGCLASRKFVRTEVKTSEDTLNARIDTNEGEIGEVRDGVDRVSTDLSRLDSSTAERFETVNSSVKTLNSDVQNVDRKASDAQSAVNRAAGAIDLLDEKFQNRNQFTVSEEKSVYFKLNSSRLEPAYEEVLDQIAEVLEQNPDALVVLEGRTDSTGSKDYNFQLGERRIEAVKRYLAVEKGVPIYRLHQISFGAARPVAANDTREGREKNRAVTMLILVPNSGAPVVKRNNN